MNPPTYETRVSMYRRDSARILLTLAYDGAPYVPDAADDLLFTVKEFLTDLDASALIQKTVGAGISLISGQAAVYIQLVADDTEDLAVDTVYYFGLKARIDATDRRATVASGRLSLAHEISDDVDPAITIYTADPDVAAASFQNFRSAALLAGDTYVDVTWTALSAAPTKFSTAAIIPNNASSFFGPLVILEDTITTTGCRLTWPGEAPAGARVTGTAWL